MKVLIISGGTKGLGRELSLLFGAQGFFVYALYSKDATAAGEWTNQMREQKFSGEAVKSDVSMAQVVADLNQKVIAGTTELVVIHNACPTFEPQSFHRVENQEASRMIDVNIKGGVHLAQWAVPLMVKAKKGVIVNVLSQVLNSSVKGFAPYFAAKAGLAGLTKALAAEYASLGLKIFSVSPGFMNTSMTKNWDERLKKMILSKNNAPREAREAAQIILNLTLSANTPGKGEDHTI